MTTQPAVAGATIAQPLQIVITGANRGIGLALATQLKSRGDAVLAVCRTASNELTAQRISTFAGVDLTNEQAVARLAEGIPDSSIDILINNAGIRTYESLDDLSLDRIRTQIEVNALAPLQVTAALLRKVKDNGKIVFISTRVGSIADNSSGGQYGYRISKVALNMIGVNLSLDLKPRGIAVLLLHPGFVRTNLTGGEGLVTAEESAAQLIKLIGRLTLEHTGQFYHANGDRLPW